MKTSQLVFVFSLILHCVTSQGPSDDLTRTISIGKTVVTQSGPIRGSLENYGTAGGRMYSWKGIPYAQPPLGNLRFRAPVPIQPWTTTRDAFEFGSNCVQVRPFTSQMSGSEDCLFLNVFTPYRIQGQLPVIVSIHGGAFKIGSGDTSRLGPETLIEQDIIYVSMNYRLNVFGFLNSGDRQAPGNFGMKDIILSLRWVRENIAAFGGNPNDVTIQGISAGSMLVHALLLSPAANGLYHKAISQSGTTFTTDAFNMNPRDSLIRLARRLYLHYTSIEDLVNQLRRVSTTRLLAAANTFEKGAPSMYETGEFTITLDPVDSLEARIMIDTPHNLIRRGIVNRVPYLIGFCSVEQLDDINKIAGDATITERFIENRNLLVPQLWNLQPGSSQANEVITSFENMYFNGRLNASSDFGWQFANYASDRHFAYGVSKVVRTHSALQTVYYYRFSYSGAFNFNKIRAGLTAFPGASHTEDAFYMFRHNQLLGNVAQTDFAFTVRTRYSTLMGNFIKTGNPTPGLDPALGFIWPRTTTTNLEYLDVDQSFVVRNHPYQQRLDMFMNFDRRFLL